MLERGGRKKNREMLRAVGKGKEKEKGKKKGGSAAGPAHCRPAAGRSVGSWPTGAPVTQPAPTASARRGLANSRPPRGREATCRLAVGR